MGSETVNEYLGEELEILLTCEKSVFGTRNENKLTT